MMQELLSEFQLLANPEKAKILSGFFKTGKGQYGEGDVFLGIVVPLQRKLAKRYSTISLADIQTLLYSKIHEHRLTALFILILQYGKLKSQTERKLFVDFYLANAKSVNNWDLVDQSAPNILGTYLLNETDRSCLYSLVKSKNLWERRIAVLATFAFIRNGDFADTIKLSELLLKDSHDLMHKAVGWMLRETGKRDLPVLKEFLNLHAGIMPRTMLRYAIEKLPEVERKWYMNNNNFQSFTPPNR